MFFRNLTLFRFAAPVAESLDDLDTALDAHRLRPCGAMEMSTHGFVPPLGPEAEALTHGVGNSLLVTVGSEDKLLPTSVVNEELSRKVRKLAEAEGRRVGGRERKRLKQETLDQLMPRAFSRPSRMQVWLQRKLGWAVFDTSSRKAAEEGIQHCAWPWAASPRSRWPQKSPRALMTDWLTMASCPPAWPWGTNASCAIRPTRCGGALSSPGP